MSKARLDPVSEQAIDWMVRLRAGKTDARMQERFNAWLALDPAHAQAWARLQERLGGSWNTLRTLENACPVKRGKCCCSTMVRGVTCCAPSAAWDCWAAAYGWRRAARWATTCWPTCTPRAASARHSPWPMAAA